MSENTPAPQPQVVIQQPKNSGCKIAALIFLGLFILGVGGCALVTFLGASAVNEVSKSMDEAKAKQQAIVDDLELMDFKWSKEGFGSVMEASFTIGNNGTKDIKDIKIECTHFAASGTKIDSNTRTIYDVIKAGESRTFDSFNMGFIHEQAERSVAKILSATTVPSE